jgi:hypothetical protein
VPVKVASPKEPAVQLQLPILTVLSVFQAVLVSVDSLTSLINAYPNYYLDTAEFLNLVHRVITEDPRVYSGEVSYVGAT